VAYTSRTTRQPALGMERKPSLTHRPRVSGSFQQATTNSETRPERSRLKEVVCRVSPFSGVIVHPGSRVCAGHPNYANARNHGAAQSTTLSELRRVSISTLCFTMKKGGSPCHVSRGAEGGKHGLEIGHGSLKGCASLMLMLTIMT
jgi:hypothetical protein